MRFPVVIQPVERRLVRQHDRHTAGAGRRARVAHEFQIDDTGAITSEAFYDLNVPREPAVFKDPLTASTRIYVNDPGRDLLESLAAKAGLSGLECGEPRDY